MATTNGPASTGTITFATTVPSTSPACSCNRTIPTSVAKRWSQILKRPRDPDYGAIFVDNAAIDFVKARDGRGEGIEGIGLAVADKGAILKTAAARKLPVVADTVTICGVRFEFVDAE